MIRVPVPRRGTAVVNEDPLTYLTANDLAWLESAIAAGDGQHVPAASLPNQNLATIGQPGDSTGPQAKLFAYWTHGAGAAKIRWGTSGSFMRCVHHLERHVPPNYSVRGLCANLHKRATGEWPTEHGKAGIPS